MAFAGDVTPGDELVRVGVAGKWLAGRRVYAAVAAVAVIVYLGALWNRFALDDLYIIVYNSSVHSLAGVWRGFAEPYWPAEFGGKMYRPLAMATFALDWPTASTAWFHLVNVLWHAGATVLVAALARHWAGDAAALAAGVIFAVHPVHVEAVANVVGRAELMAAAFALLSVYAALVRRSVWGSAAALLGGLLSKENAAVVPGFVAWAWILGIGRPSRHDILRFVAAWALVGAGYAAARWIVLHPFARYAVIDPVLVGLGPVAIRLTGVAAFADVTRLLLSPLSLSADYSRDQRTGVLTVLDGRLLLGMLCLGLWVVLLLWARRRRRPVETFGLGALAIAYLPVANLLFPIGVLVGERSLYLPSVGLALAAGAALARLPTNQLYMVIAVLALAGGARSALRVPVWRDDRTVTLSMLEDAPESYRGPARMGALYASQRDPRRALAAFRVATRIFDGDPRIFAAAADAAFTLGRWRLADSLLARAELLCIDCPGMHRGQARIARDRADEYTVEWLEFRAAALERRWRSQAK